MARCVICLDEICNLLENNKCCLCQDGLPVICSDCDNRKDKVITLSLTRSELSRLIIALNNQSRSLLEDVLDSSPMSVYKRELIDTIEMHQKLVRLEVLKGWYN